MLHHSSRSIGVQIIDQTIVTAVWALDRDPCIGYSVDNRNGGISASSKDHYNGNKATFVLYQYYVCKSITITGHSNDYICGSVLVHRSGYVDASILGHHAG